MIKILLICFFLYSSLFSQDRLLKCGTLNNLAPLSIKNSNNNVDGISIEYWKIVEKHLHIKTKCSTYTSWDKILDAFKKNKIDIMLIGTKSLHIKNAVFSKSYDSFPISIATKDNISFVPDIRVLSSDKIGIIKDSISYNIIRHKYKKINFIVFDNIEEALNELEEGNIKAVIGLLPILIAGINEGNYLSIRISGKININTKLNFMLNKKYDYLIPKINKSLDKISMNKRLAIYDKWLKLDNFWTWEKIEFLLSIGIITLILLFILTFILIRDIKRRDILEKELIKSKEKAEIATKAKSEFLANMSHEIRTPLNAIFGFIAILKDKEKDEKKYKYLKIIEKSSKNLQSIIDDILDFSKIDTGKFKLEKKEINLEDELKTVVSLFKSKAKDDNLILQSNIPKLNNYLITDSIRLKQIISHLLNNAIKFSKPNKNIYFNIEYDEKKELLYIEVKDEGIGIAKEKLDTIFEAFNQADNSTTRKYGGTGLGLSISYKLVEMLGGKLKVDSKIGEGSKFYFTISVQKGNKIVKKINVKNDELNEQYNYHILLAEDNKANQMFMSVILKKLNITFDLANDGFEAIELFKKNKYDLILMDENMPNMNGIEAVKQIRKYEQDNNLKATIISAFTADLSSGGEEKFLSAGMDYYLSKPLDISKFKLILEKIKTF